MQVEVHPYFRNDALLSFCRSEGIHMTAYSPLGSPDSATPAKRYFSLFKHPLVKELASKYDKDPGQVGCAAGRPEPPLMAAMLVFKHMHAVYAIWHVFQKGFYLLLFSH